MSDIKDHPDYRAGKRIMWWVFGFSIVVGLAIAVFSRGCSVVDKLVDPDRAVSTYEDFHNMYEQAEQICNDIVVIETSADSVSGGFSKSERVMGLENKLNEVIRDYNAKSKAWTRNMWKDKDLPHTLKRSDFNCKNN